MQKWLNYSDYNEVVELIGNCYLLGKISCLLSIQLIIPPGVDDPEIQEKIRTIVHSLVVA